MALILIFPATPPLVTISGLCMNGEEKPMKSINTIWMVKKACGEEIKTNIF